MLIREKKLEEHYDPQLSRYRSSVIIKLVPIVVIFPLIPIGTRKNIDQIEARKTYSFPPLKFCLFTRKIEEQDEYTSMPAP